MDPNATLAEMDRIMSAANGKISHVKGADRARLIELTTALREWWIAGGFDPNWDLYPFGTTRFVVASNLGRSC